MHPRSYPTLYELAPIGVDMALEAIACHHFCSVACRNTFRLQPDAPAEPTSDGDEPDITPGERCSWCETQLEGDPI